jgi:hypothetical protein
MWCFVFRWATTPRCGATPAAAAVAAAVARDGPRARPRTEAAQATTASLPRTCQNVTRLGSRLEQGPRYWLSLHAAKTWNHCDGRGWLIWWYFASETFYIGTISSCGSAPLFRKSLTN